MEHFFDVQQENQFELFGLVHLIPVFIMIVLLLFIYLYRKSLNQFEYEKWIRYFYGSLLLVNECSIYIWRYFNGILTIDNLPFELCSYTMPLTVILLFTKKKFIHDITFFWGIGGGIVALFMPTIRDSYDSYRYYQFMFGHTTIIIVSFYMLWVHHMIPTIKSFVRSFSLLIIVGIYSLVFNILFNTNYMGLKGSLEEKTLVDYLGPYPLNIVFMSILAFILYCLIYFPVHIYYHRKFGK